MPGIGLGIGKCPYDPIDNSTAIYVESGSPGGFPVLVRDTFADLINLFVEKEKLISNFTRKCHEILILKIIINLILLHCWRNCPDDNNKNFKKGENRKVMRYRSRFGGQKAAIANFPWRL